MTEIRVCKNGHEYPYPEVPYCSQNECMTLKVINLLDEQGNKYPFSVEPNGLMTYAEGCKYPMPAGPTDIILGTTATVKRTFLVTPKFFLKLLIYFWSPKRILESIGEWINQIYIADYKNKLLPFEHFNVFIRELIRATKDYCCPNESNPYENLGTPNIFDWIYCLGMIFEMDLAYRFRLLDVLALLNQDNLRKNPRKEINRLIKIGQSRELNVQVQPKWKQLNILVNLAMIFSPRVKKGIKDILLNLDMKNAIIWRIQDKYWVANRFDYNYLGQTYNERWAWRLEEDKNWNKIIPIGLEGIKSDLTPKNLERPKISINPPNESFYLLNETGAEEMAEQTKQAILENYKAGQKR